MTLADISATCPARNGGMYLPISSGTGRNHDVRDTDRFVVVRVAEIYERVPARAFAIASFKIESHEIYGSMLLAMNSTHQSYLAVSNNLTVRQIV